MDCLGRFFVLNRKSISLILGHVAALISRTNDGIPRIIFKDMIKNILKGMFM